MSKPAGADFSAPDPAVDVDGTPPAAGAGRRAELEELVDRLRAKVTKLRGHADAAQASLDEAVDELAGLED